jgi:Capsule polysaccharide biosynthesis protein
MRVLFFLEPVIFRDDPAFLTAHVLWVDCIKNAVIGLGGNFALAANADVCEIWRNSLQDELMSTTCFALNSYSVLAAFGFRRSDYAKALYGSGVPSNVLLEDLSRIRKEFDPDLVVMTSQNAFARRAFLGVPIYSVEQAPLPRLGHPFRTAFDPCGHQTGAILETHADRIKNLPLRPDDRTELWALMRNIESYASTANALSLQAREAINVIKRDGPVALLVTQPPDWVTYEGALQNIELEGLLCSWVASLPIGWIGVPTYHPGFRLRPQIEQAIARSFPQIRFLPHELSQGLTESMLTCADGVITLSSTTAMTALLLQKRVVVTGRAPYNAWCLQNPADIESAKPLTDDEVCSTLAFLSNRFSYIHSTLLSEPKIIQNLIEVAISKRDLAEWFLDLSTWSISQAQSQFSIPDSIE